MDRKSLDKMTRPPVGYWFEDGLVELIVGGIIVILGVFFLLEGYSAPGTGLRRASGYTTLGLMVLSPWVGRWILRRFRARWTYPRTGYATLRQPKPKARLWSLGVAALVAFGTVWVFNRLPSGRVNWVPLIEGFTIGGFMFYQGYLANLPRLRWLGTGAIILGGFFASIGLGELVGTGMFLVVVGGLLFFLGYRTLRKFVKVYPIEGMDLDDRPEEGRDA